MPGSTTGISERCCTLFETCGLRKGEKWNTWKELGKINNAQEASNFSETAFESIRRETLNKGSSYLVVVGKIDLFQTEHPSTGMFMPFARMEDWQFTRHESNEPILSRLWSAS